MAVKVDSLSEATLSKGQPRKRPEVLRAQIVAELRTLGSSTATASSPFRKASRTLRPLLGSLHREHLRTVLEKNARFVEQWEDKLLDHFANGAEVDPARIVPRIVPVQSAQEASLFRLASLHWSVPVSVGYGRRTRFLVYDDQNGKLMGIFALGDPVFNLAVRDRLIGWTSEEQAGPALQHLRRLRPRRGGAVPRPDRRQDDRGLRRSQRDCGRGGGEVHR